MILDTIVRHKHEEVRAAQKKIPLDTIMRRIDSAPPVRDFARAVRKKRSGEGCAHTIIAEVKKGSPSKGLICQKFDHTEIADGYEKNGAAAVSVLTDEKFFMGSNRFLTDIRTHISIPVFRKDFIIDPYQIYESRSIGADALLLIAAVLDDDKLNNFLMLTMDLGMSALVEIHDLEDLDKALRAGSQILGINNRDLRTFSTDIATTVRLVPRIPSDKTIVSESGISSLDDVESLEQHGVHAFLIGENLMRHADPGARLSYYTGLQ